MENKDLIIVEQLPVIKEQLKQVAEKIDKKVEEAKSLICTEENKQVVKNVRAEMKKELEEFEKKRKSVKEKILSPYMQFEEVYKVCISEKYKSADQDLKAKIDNIESEQKKKLEDGAREYFKEYKETKNIDFINFENMNLKIGLSDNPTKLKKQITSYIDKILDDLKLIETQQNKNEILVEYKKDLNVSRAITEVVQRKEQLKAMEEARINTELEKEKQVLQDNLSNLANASIPQNMPSTGEAIKTTEKLYTITFKVTDNSVRLKKLHDFLVEGGYKYE